MSNANGYQRGEEFIATGTDFTWENGINKDNYADKTVPNLFKFKKEYLLAINNYI